MIASGDEPACLNRWRQSQEHLQLSLRALRSGDYLSAIKLLDTAHNLGRDHILLHASSHLCYARVTLHAKDYRRTAGHLVWAVASPLFVPLERHKRSTLASSGYSGPFVRGENTSSRLDGARLLRTSLGDPQCSSESGTITVEATSFLTRAKDTRLSIQSTSGRT